MFQYKPDGEVTFRTAQDAQGLPAPVMQDPMHYPHATGYMAPGMLPTVSALFVRLVALRVIVIGAAGRANGTVFPVAGRREFEGGHGEACAQP